MTITIQANIPVPAARGKYPWRTMKVGDSFFVKTDAERKSAQNSAAFMGFKITTRKIKGGYRLWRTA